MDLLRWPSSLDADALALRVLEPTRPALDLARATLGDAHEPREAMEIAAARGLCPLEWLDPSARAFAAVGAAPSPAPKSARAVIALVSDVSGVLAAEALAREFVQRARPWSTLPPSHAPLVWVEDAVESPRDGRHPTQPILPRALDVLSPGSYRSAVVARAVAALEAQTDERAQRPLRSWLARVALRVMPREPRTPYESQWASLLYGRVEAARQTAWHRAIEEHRRAWLFALLSWAGESLASSLETRALQWIPNAMRSAPLASFRNPFEPMARLWSTGYALHRAAEDAVELFLPLPVAPL